MGRARHSVRAAPVNRSVELLDGSHGVTRPYPPRGSWRASWDAQLPGELRVTAAAQLVEATI